VAASQIALITTHMARPRTRFCSPTDHFIGTSTPGTIAGRHAAARALQFSALRADASG
jgi:hypothetical protein